jgi:hypothetical protein
MAHWVAVINEPERKVLTGKTKEEVIFNVGVMLTNRYMASTVTGQLKRARESTAIAYGLESEVVAKVFPCNCGSVKKHQKGSENA